MPDQPIVRTILPDSAAYCLKKLDNTSLGVISVLGRNSRWILVPAVLGLIATGPEAKSASGPGPLPLNTCECMVGSARFVASGPGACVMTISESDQVCQVIFAAILPSKVNVEGETISFIGGLPELEGFEVGEVYEFGIQVIADKVSRISHLEVLMKASPDPKTGNYELKDANKVVSLPLTQGGNTVIYKMIPLNNFERVRLQINASAVSSDGIRGEMITLSGPKNYEAIEVGTLEALWIGITKNIGIILGIVGPAFAVYLVYLQIKIHRMKLREKETSRAKAAARDHPVDQNEELTGTQTVTPNENTAEDEVGKK